MLKAPFDQNDQEFHEVVQCMQLPSAVYQFLTIFSRMEMLEHVVLIHRKLR